MEFVEQSNVYKPHLPMMQVMFGACLRVSETIGLTWSDVDMKNREIHVGGQLVYYEGDEGYCFHDSETKTDAGIRDIPMTQMVYDAFRKQRELNLMLCLQSKVEISRFVWFSLQRFSEESTKLNVSGDSSAGYDWRASFGSG